MPFSHIPHPAILLWCLFTIPFTLWDSAYLFLRPRSLPNHPWHHPWFSLGGTYTTWAEVDRSYGEKGWNEGDGFVLAQAVVNLLVEVLGHGVYLWLVMMDGGAAGRLWTWNKEYRKCFRDGRAARAVVVGLMAGVVTLTKTVLYFMREAFSGFRYTGHNDWWTFLSVWCGMNLLYFIASAGMIIIFGKEIINGLASEMPNSRVGTEKNSKKSKH